MFALEVDYLLGRAFAGDYRDRSASEWPPHPARLYSALASAWFEGGANERERGALEWLERLAPPSIRAGKAGEPAVTVAFVPTNYPGDSLPERGKQPRFFPAQGPSEATVCFIWPDQTPDATTRQALDDLAARVGYLGKACSLVRMRINDEPPQPNYVPNPAGKLVLRYPAEGRLRELEWLYAAGQQPWMAPVQRYAVVGKTKMEAVASEFGEMIVFRRIAGPGLPIEAVLTLSEAVRKTLMSIAGEHGALSEWIHGHGSAPHCAIVPLPFVGESHADGHLLGFAVILPRATDPGERRRVLAACGRLETREIHLPRPLWPWQVEWMEMLPRQLSLQPGTWTGPSRRWVTVTPILLDRFPKKKGPSVEDILCAACVRIGLPEPAVVEHGPYSHVQGVPPVPQFRLARKDDRPRWGVHATLEFPAPVRGPVLLGAGRYFGMGLLKPDRRQPDDQL